LIDKLSGPLGSDRDGVDGVTGDKVNIMIVEVNKGSTATFNKPPKPNMSPQSNATLLQGHI